MADGEKQGLASAIALMGVGDAPAADDGASQAELFDAEDAPTPLGAVSGRGRSGPQGGRPLGSRNRRTEEWTNFILAQYRSPLVVMAETYSMPVHELAAKLNCDPLDAFKAQQAAAAALAPYLHQRQPMAVEVATQTRGLLLIGEFGGDGAADSLALPLPDPEIDDVRGLGIEPVTWEELTGEEVQENQQLSDATGEKSDGAKSRTDANALLSKGSEASGQ